MLVPSPQLIRLTAAVLLPAAAVGGIVPGTAGIALGLVIVVALFVLWDAFSGFRQLDDLEVSMPEVLRLTQGRRGCIPVRLSGHAPRPRTLLAALGLPESLDSDVPVVTVPMPARTERLEIAWPVTALRRGRDSISSIQFETASPHRLWGVRRRLSVHTEVRIYPNLFQDRRSTASVFLNRSGPGAHVQRQVGQGREFEKLRDYAHQDSVSDIHWKATAKRGRPVTKVFQIERTQEVYVILDASRLSGRLTDGEPEFECSLRSALLLAAAADRQGDLFGTVAFDSRVRCFVRSGRGRAHVAACREALFALQPQPASPDFGELCTTLRLRLRRRALLVFLTSLDDPVLAEEFLRGIGLLSRQHLVLAIQPRPAAAQPLFASADVATTGDVYARLGGHVRWQKLRLLEQQLRQRNVRFTLANPGTLAATVLQQYLEVRQRQLL